jgi:hypothetical protein
VFAVFVAGVLGSLSLLVHPWFDVTNDGSIYLVTARSLAAGEGYTYLGEPFQVRPPGLPALLVPLLASVGTDFAVLNAYVAVFGAVGVVLLFCFQLPRLGFGLALLTALAVWLNPGYQRLSTQIMSDVPGVTLLLACLLVERWARRAPDWRRELALGLCIGLSAYVRSLLVLLVPAIAASRLLEHWIAARRGTGAGPAWRFAAQRLLLFAAAAVLVLLPWTLRNHRLSVDDPAEQVSLHSYGVAMWRVDPTQPDSPLVTPAELLRRVPLRSRQIASVLGSRMQSELRGNYEPTEALRLSDAAFALLCLGSSLCVLVRRREAAEFFVAGSLLALVTYFSFRNRLVLPIYVLGLPAAVDVGRDLLARAAGERAAAFALGAALLLLIGIDFAPRRGWDEIERRHRETLEVSRAVASTVGPDARLATAFGEYYSVFLERPVYSLQIAARRSKSFVAMERIIDRHRIDTVFLVDQPERGRAFIRYFVEHYGEPQRVGPALIWRIPRD